MPDRYVDAVRARRAELRAVHDQLAGSHRTELRGELALSRLAASDAAASALARLAREARLHVDGADRAGRDRLPGLVAAAAVAVSEAVEASWSAELRPAVRRIATTRGLAVDPRWPRLPDARHPTVTPAGPEPARVSLLAGTADGLALWRLVLLPLAVLPLLGLPVLGGLALAPLAIGAGAAGVVVAIRSRRLALRRAAMRRCVDETVAAARVTIDADLARRLLELERTAGAELDRAVAWRRAVIAAELRLLEPVEVPGG